jgi:hypothetical protein
MSDADAVRLKTSRDGWTDRPEWKETASPFDVAYDACSAVDWFSVIVKALGTLRI